jgi:hypothetical protein
MAQGKKPLTFWDYVKGAFNAKPNIKGLGNVPVNWLYVLGVGVAGLVNPGFLFIGAGLELAYLFLVSHDPRFRKWMEAIAAAEESGDHLAKKRAMLSGLTHERQQRYLALEKSCSQLFRMGQGMGPTAASVAEGVNRLLWVFLKLLVSSQMLEMHMKTAPRRELEQQIESYQREYDAAAADPNKERLAKSLESTLEIARKRLENYDQAGNQAQFIQAELLRIEQQVALMVQEAILNKDAGALVERVDDVMGSFAQTHDWMKQNAEILGPIQDDLETAPPTFQVNS